ncbi:MAG: 4-hydroxy-3-methylbut-2-enyl diphosphate reductase, partial [Sphingomonadaceae bacterium]|nr:4-hydroxy-3-methylbut-2-enyl diphosphate reductase [Sphingomonadaceae bacterium]
ATCPLVSKVHRQAERFVDQGRHILFVGHARHPEVIGTFGQVAEGAMTLVETVEDAQRVQPPAGPLGFLTQTTLSVDDTRDILAILQSRFPDLVGPKGEDICYATSNRQEAVKALAAQVELVLVIGSPKSSNSLRLVEVADRNGACAQLIQCAADVDWRWFQGVSTLGITAGASAPEDLVQELLVALRERYDVQLTEVRTASEDIIFKLPRGLA